MPNCIRLENPIFANQRAYAIGEPVDFRGMSVDAVYDDGSRETLSVEKQMFHEANLQAEGVERKCFITYMGCKLPIMAPLNGLRLDHIEVAGPSLVQCEAGKPFDGTKVTVSAHYDDGSSRSITNFKMYPHEPLTEDQTSVMLKYGRCQTDVAVLVSKECNCDQPQDIVLSDPVPDSKTANAEMSSPAGQEEVLKIAFSRFPSKNLYVERDPAGIDVCGAELFVQMEDGRLETVSVSADMLVSADISHPGQSEVTIGYHGATASYPIVVVPRKPISLEIQTPPLKLEYSDGDVIDKTGMVVVMKYDNGETEEVSNYAISPVIASVDSQEVTVHSSAKTAKFSIFVQSPAIRSLSWVSQPAKTEYVIGDDTFSAEGGVIAVCLDNGKVRDIPLTPEMIVGFHTDAPGDIPVAVLYQGSVLPFSIKVQEPPPATGSDVPCLPAENPPGDVDSHDAAADVPPRKEIPNFYPSSFSFRFVDRQKDIDIFS